VTSISSGEDRDHMFQETFTRKVIFDMAAHISLNVGSRFLYRLSIFIIGPLYKNALLILNAHVLQAQHVCI
jgi:hypothetical protein